MYFYMHKLSLLSKRLSQDSSVCSEPNHFIYFHDYGLSIQLVLEDVCLGLLHRGSQQGTKMGKCTLLVVVDTGKLLQMLLGFPNQILMWKRWLSHPKVRKVGKENIQAQIGNINALKAVRHITCAQFRNWIMKSIH